MLIPLLDEVLLGMIAFRIVLLLDMVLRSHILHALSVGAYHHARPMIAETLAPRCVCCCNVLLQMTRVPRIVVLFGTRVAAMVMIVMVTVTAIAVSIGVASQLVENRHCVYAVPVHAKRSEGFPLRDRVTLLSYLLLGLVLRTKDEDRCPPLAVEPRVRAAYDTVSVCLSV